MPVSLAELQKGHEFPPAHFELTSEWVAQYTAAVGDATAPPLGSGIVPPMAVATLCIRTLLEQASLPPGSIHAAQEIAFERTVKTGDTLAASARIVGRGERAGWVLMNVALDATSGGLPVMIGRATITFPIAPETAD